MRSGTSDQTQTKHGCSVIDQKSWAPPSKDQAVEHTAVVVPVTIDVVLLFMSMCCVVVVCCFRCQTLNIPP